MWLTMHVLYGQKLSTADLSPAFHRWPRSAVPRFLKPIRLTCRSAILPGTRNPDSWRLRDWASERMDWRFYRKFRKGVGSISGLATPRSYFVLGLESSSFATLRSFSAAWRAFVDGVGFPCKAEPIFTIEIVWFAAGLLEARFTWKEQ